MSRHYPGKRHPKYGHYTDRELRDLVASELAAASDRPENADGQAALAMRLATRTGASYAWLWSEVERQVAEAAANA